MKRFLNHYLVLGILCIWSGLAADSSVAPYFSIRSQSVDSARELVGWTHFVNLFDKDCNYGVFSIIPEYTRSFNSTNIAECLFGPDLVECREIHISGSRVQGRNSGTDWLADYFGLPVDFQSTLSVRPMIENMLVDFNFYIGLDSIVDGLYFRVHAPVVHTRWRLNVDETIVAPGVTGYDAGYFGPFAVPRAQLLGSFSDYVCDGATPILANIAANAATPGPVFNQLEYGKWNCNKLTQTKLSDIIWALGWNFWQNCDYHVGVNVRGAIPTGTRPSGEYFFEPVVGNGHHWELGAGFTSHYTFWRDNSAARSMGVYVDANFTHLFATRQTRSFDLANKPNSRYALAQQIAEPAVNLFAANALGVQVEQTAQFKDVYTSVVNLTTVQMDVSATLQVDLTALFNYHNDCGFEWDLGYNFWTRSCEKLSFNRSRCLEPDLSTWALKGDAHVYGFANVGGPIAAGTAIGLAATENQATIHGGTNNFVGLLSTQGGINGVRPTANPGIDNPGLATTNGIQTILDAVGGVQTRSSNPALFLSTDSFDCGSNRTRGLSHKLFTNFNFFWNDLVEEYVPYVGFGGKIEFAQHSSHPSAVVPCECSSYCATCGVSEWGIWLKAGLAYN